MSKSKKIIIGVLISIFIIAVIYSIFSVFNNQKIENSNETNPNKFTKNSYVTNNDNSERTRIIRVNGKLYYDTEKESTITARCGNMDGKITTNVDISKIPSKDNQSNFDGNYEYQYGEEDTIEVKIDNKWIIFKGQSQIFTALTLEDEIQDNTIWCGTFQLIWNDMKNDLAKQDIEFTPQSKLVENLNKETFTTKDLSDKYYYKIYGTPTRELKSQIEKDIKKKFNEKSDILDDFEWVVKDPKDCFLYTMLKKEFKFEKEFEELENSNFGNHQNISYFGIKTNSENYESRTQVTVLYYNSKEDFAIKLKTKQEDEVILCKNPNGNTFNEIYKNINENSKNFRGNKNLEKGELLKIPNIKVNEKTEFTELEQKIFFSSNGEEYEIEKALQTIQFELDKTGGKVKSEAGMMVRKNTATLIDETREFSLNDTFAIFLVEHGKENPYFAGKINNITKFQ